MTTEKLRTNTEFSARLRAARARLGMVQADLARILEVSAGSVGNWESGQNTPSHRMLQRLAETLETTVGWLLNGEESQRESAETSKAPPWVEDLQHRLSGHSEQKRRRVLAAFHAILDAVDPEMGMPPRKQQGPQESEIPKSLAPLSPPEDRRDNPFAPHPNPKIAAAVAIEMAAAMDKVLKSTDKKHTHKGEDRG